MEPKEQLLGAIEAGGTKFVCAVAEEPGEPLLETRFPTTSPRETLGQVAAFFDRAARIHGPIRSMGIGSFGPADVDPDSPGYGGILTTPKEGWEGFNFVDRLREIVGAQVPIAFDTDVNAAAIGEAEFGAGRGHRSLCYVTVGTGIGGGLLLEGRPLHGRLHPEIGHMVMPDFDAAFDRAVNHCPFHDSCFEGRASGPAIEERWGRPGAELPEDDPAWELEARYLAAGALNLTAAWSPDVLLIGGGVAQQEGLMEKVRREFEAQAGGYWSLPPLDRYLRTPALGQHAGIVGALCLARRLV